MSVAAAGGDPLALAPKLDQWVGAPVMEEKGGGVLAEVQQDRVVYLARFAADGKGDMKRLTEQTGTVAAHDEAAGHVAVLWSTDSTISELYALENGKLRKLTAHNDALLASLSLASTADLSAKGIGWKRGAFSADDAAGLRGGHQGSAAALDSWRTDGAGCPRLHAGSADLCDPRVRDAECELSREHRTRPCLQRSDQRGLGAQGIAGSRSLGGRGDRYGQNRRDPDGGGRLELWRAS